MLVENPVVNLEQGLWYSCSFVVNSYRKDLGPRDPW